MNNLYKIERKKKQCHKMPHPKTFDLGFRPSKGSIMVNQAHKNNFWQQNLDEKK